MKEYKITTRLAFCELIAHYDKQVSSYIRENLEPESLLTLFIDPKGVKCELIYGTKHQIYILREGKRLVLNTLIDFTNTLRNLFDNN